MMKKIVIFSLLALSLLGCEKKVDITPKEEKEKIITGHYNRENEMRKKYYDIKDELQKLADEGNKSAEEELARWEKVESEVLKKRALQISEKTKKDVEEMRKTGKIW